MKKGGTVFMNNIKANFMQQAPKATKESVDKTKKYMKAQIDTIKSF